MLLKEAPDRCRLVATHHSILETLRELTTGYAVHERAMALMCEALQPAQRDSKTCLKELKRALEPNLELFGKYIKRIHRHKEHWEPQHIDFYTGGLHSYNRTGCILANLQQPLPVEASSRLFS